MENAAYIALSREVALRRQMDAVANNLANLSTPAFKSQSILFKEYLAPTPDGGTVSYVQEDKAVRDTSEGPMTATRNPLDLAIHGDGYFVVSTRIGPRFTRMGDFQLDAKGQIVTSDGNPLLNDKSRPIVVPPKSGEIAVARDGTIQAGKTKLGKVQLASFEDQQAMQEVSSGVYYTDAAPKPSEDGEIVQGMIEESNVKGVVELTRMMELVRSYQAVQKMLDNESDRQRQAIDQITGPTS